MRLKPVPEPPSDLHRLTELQQAVPLVPGTTNDCCARLVDRCNLSTRQDANDWLAFLRAMGLVDETAHGFVRAEVRVTPDRIRTGLQERILFAPVAISLLETATVAAPVTASSLHKATRESVPRHDRERDSNWERTWKHRAARLLQWFELVDLAVRVESPAVEPTAERNSSDSNSVAASRDIGYVAGDAL